MAFMSLEVFFEKKLLNFAFFSLSTCYLVSLMRRRMHNTLLLFEEGSMKKEHILRAKVWLYGLECSSGKF